jgi:hypothetical protein
MIDQNGLDGSHDAVLLLALAALTNEEFIEWIATCGREGVSDGFEVLRAGTSGNQTSEGIAA